MDKRLRWVEFSRYTKIVWLIPLILMYLLGLSLAHHLGGGLRVADAVIGFFVVLCLFAMRVMLNAFFDHPESLVSVLKPGEPDWDFLKTYKKQTLLQGSLLVLTAGAVLTVILMVRGVITLTSMVYLGALLLGYFVLAAPPLRLDKTGYGEMVEGIITVTLVPAFSLSFSGKEVSLLLFQLTLPLLFIYLAAKLAFSFREYGTDIIRERNTVVTRIGWQNAVVLHNSLILSAFGLIGVFLLLGFPWSLSWPLLLGLPLGALQIIQFLRIAEGDKPKWRLVLWMAMGLFVLVSYLVILSLWT